jgi:hypothetical protein
MCRVVSFHISRTTLTLASRPHSSPAKSMREASLIAAPKDDISKIDALRCVFVAVRNSRRPETRTTTAHLTDAVGNCRLVMSDSFIIETASPPDTCESELWYDALWEAAICTYATL